MSEESATSDSDAEVSALGADPFAAEVGLNAASRKEGDAFLRAQQALISDQRHHLREQFKQLSVTLWEKRLGVTLRLATILAGFAVVVGGAFMVWQAAQTSGLRIEPFSVPPDLSARGITGEVVAGRLLDQLNLMQRQSNSRRAGSTYASDWGEKAIKLEIPETGVSVAELDRYLREKLGHDITVTGDIIAVGKGVTLTVRAGGSGFATIDGEESSLANLVRQAAEHIYRLTQPYRYALYIRAQRPDESFLLLKDMAQKGLDADRPWALNAWALHERLATGVDGGLPLFERALALQPDSSLIMSNIADTYLMKGEWEASLAYESRAIRLMNSSQALYRPETLEPARLSFSSRRDRLLGDFRQAAEEASKVIEFGDTGQLSPVADLALAQLGLHEMTAARRMLAYPAAHAFMREFEDFNTIWAEIQIDSAQERWRDVLAQRAAAEKQIQTAPGLRTQVSATLVPFFAVAQARLGQFAAAKALIGPTPGICDLCLIARGQIADLQRQAGQADYWFARAEQNAPSAPFASAAWGRALLTRSDADAAIEKFKLANRKRPHFADPLEGWGEALMAKNRSDLARAKFAEAEKYAPNWGRLHLKWGEALIYTGKRDVAKAQFARAAQLDLTPSEKAELARRP